ncbi:hypothetical protein Zm00014a_019594 [Zea mays]|uniref:Uncharacterized protein n=1 Tax=Zea mays TaxID=4577 RepID=A0A3L6G3V5_MAIZE|nr:hypothetical protein Zm00014a_019594 [Zea mays]
MRCKMQMYEYNESSTRYFKYMLAN